MQENHIIKTHRCKQLLERNKDYKNGAPIRIFYGCRFWCYNPETSEKAWWLDVLQHDFDYDTNFMTTVGKIDYCPCCGIFLEEVEN